MTLLRPLTAVSKSYVRYNGWDGPDCDRKEGWGILESAGNWGLPPARPMSQQNRILNISHLMALYYILWGLETANAEFTELYSLLGDKFEAWVQRGPIHLAGRRTLPCQTQSRFTPGRNASWKQSMHTYIGLWLYHWVCFRDRAFAVCGASGGCGWKPNSLARTAY